VLLFDDPVTATALAGMALIIVAGVAASVLRQRSAAVRPDATSSTLET
jgi:hypothetical protein